MNHSNSNLNDIVYANNVFVTVGNTGVIYSSSGSNSWKQIYTGAIATSFNSVSYDNGEFIAMGGGKTLLISLDGVIWQDIPMPDITDSNGNSLDYNIIEVVYFAGE